MAGRVFALTRPKLAAYTHIVAIGKPASAAADARRAHRADARRAYDGPLAIGEDLMSFDIGDTVTVKRLMPRP